MTFDIEVRPEDFARVKEIQSNLEGLGSKHGLMLAHFLVALMNKYPGKRAVNVTAFIVAAIAATNAHGMSSCVDSLDELYQSLPAE